MDKLFLVPLVITFVIALTDLPRRQPDALAPIQMLTLYGIAALVLLQIANIVAALYWSASLPPGIAAGFALLHLLSAAIALITTASILLRSVLRPRRRPSSNVAALLQTEVDALKQVVCGERGISDIRLYRGSANGTEVEVTRTPEGAEIRVGERLPEKLAHFTSHSSGGRKRVRALIRFILLHELGHILNGDHLAYQYARAVMLGQLWYVVPLLALQPPLLAMWVRGVRIEELGAVSGMAALLTFTAITTGFQRFLAERFASAREQLADWRATVTLTAAEEARLLEAQTGDRPFLEKALSALRPPPMPSALRFLFTLMWPSAGRIDARVDHLRDGTAEGRHEPLRWAGVAGFNAGALTVMAISFTGALAMQWGESFAQSAAFGIAVIVASFPAMMLVGRADATDPFSGESISWERRIVTLAAYLLAFCVVVFAGYVLLYGVPTLSPRFYATGGAVIVFVSILIGGSAYVVGLTVHTGPAALRQRGEMRMNVVPLLIGFEVMIPLSFVLARIIGSKLQHPFGVLLMPTFIVFAFGCAATASRFPLVRRLSPLGVTGAVGEIVRVRVLMVDVSADMNTVHRDRLFLRLTMMWASQIAIAFVIVAAIVLAFPRGAPDDALAVVFALSLALGMGFAFLPKAKGKTASSLERNIDTIHGLFQCRREGPLGPLLRRLAPFVINELCATQVRAIDTERDVTEIRRAALLAEIARSVHATDILAGWTRDIADMLREHAPEGVVHTWPGGPPSAFWTAWAARLAAAAPDTTAACALAESAARLLPDRLENARTILMAATIARVTAAAGSHIALPEANIHELLRATDSLSDIAAIATYTGAGLDVLREIVRTRLWQTLHANSRRELPAILDILAAGNLFGESGTPLWIAAEERLRDLLLEDNEALLRRIGSSG